jgi:hypothetical protein
MPWTSAGESLRRSYRPVGRDHSSLALSRAGSASKSDKIAAASAVFTPILVPFFFLMPF